jgi:S1-C subfamily serine protease
MASEWFVKTAKGVSGPFSTSQMANFERSGKLGSNTLVRRGDIGSWRPVNLVRHLFEVASESSSSASRENSFDPTWAFALAVGVGGAVLSSILLLIGLNLRAQPKQPIAVIGVGGDSPEAPPAPDRPPVDVPPESPVPPADGPVTLEGVMAAVAPSVALIEGQSSSGTGFVIEPGVVVTNKHVIQTECVADLRALFPSAAEDLQGPQSVTLIYKDPKHDLAFLRVKRTPPQLQMTNDHALKRGQEITVVGNPAMTGGPVLINAVSKGVMSTEATIDGNRYFQIGISVNPGNSGGPVLDSEGNVLGVVTLKDSKKEGLGFCIPPKEVLDAISHMKAVPDTNLLRINEDHDFQVIVFQIAMRGILSKVRMDTLVTAMTRAIEAGGKPNDGIETVQREVGPYVTSQEQTKDLQEAVTRIVRNDRYPEATRQRLADLWATVQSMVSYAEEPRGNFSSYREKVRQLDDDFDRQFEPLRLIVGSPFE